MSFENSIIIGAKSLNHPQKLDYLQSFPGTNSNFRSILNQNSQQPHCGRFWIAQQCCTRWESGTNSCLFMSKTTSLNYTKMVSNIVRSIWVGPVYQCKCCTGHKGTCYQRQFCVKLIWHKQLLLNSVLVW